MRLRRCEYRASRGGGHRAARMETTIYSVDDLRRIIRRVGLDRLMDEIIEEMTVACRQFDETHSNVPVRDGFHYHSPNVGLLEWMPAIEYGRQAVIKIVGYHPTNPSLRELPTILSVALNFDVTSGHLIGMVDGTFLTALRTGAASAVASRVLAPPRARVLGLIGAGAQAVSQLHALSRVFDFEQVLVYDTDPAAGESFAARASILEIPDTRISIENLDTVVTSAHILCTATSVDIGGGPVFRDLLLKPSLHINAIGSDFPGKTEVPQSVLQRGLVCPDSREQAIREGECQQIDSSDIGPDLVALVKQADQYESYRDSLTVFDSTGWALEDLVASNVIFRHGRELGCGTLVDIESLCDDPKNPYGFVESGLPESGRGTTVSRRA
jgi:ornithine cyclodeaminase